MVLSALVVTDVAAKCIPSFLPLSGYLASSFDVASGLMLRAGEEQMEACKVLA